MTLWHSRNPFALIQLIPLLLCSVSTLHASCASPTADIGSMNWNGTAFVYCDGTNWNDFGSQWVNGTSGAISYSGGNIGIGTASPGSALDLKGTLRLSGATSGYVGLAPAAAAGSTTYTLPAADGTSGQVLTTNGGGTLSWAEATGNGAPTASIITMMTSTCPSGYLEANGSAVSRATYSALFASISTNYGSGNGSTTFNLPDLRGYFLRGWDHTASNDPDRANRTNRGDGTVGDNIGTKQLDALQGHKHSTPTGTYGGNPWGSAYDFVAEYNRDASTTGTPISDGANGTPRTSSETRPKNIYVLYCIRY